MRKIYYENQYIKEFTANVVNVKIRDDKYHVELDNTAFFPGGGGQFCDLGTIENQEVKDVYEEEGIVYHVLEKNIFSKENIKCSLNWERRKDGMHQHLGQHILSGCFFKLFNANTISFHLGKESSTVDIVGSIDENAVREVEVLANKVIEENLKVESTVPLKSNLESLGLRRAIPKTEEEIRVVKIYDLDINACCGVHPSSTRELRLIKIKKWEKNKGTTRIEFLAGKRAVDYSLNREKALSELCKYLNSNEDEALNRFKNLNNEIKNLNEVNKDLYNTLSMYESKNLFDNGENIENFTIIKKVYKDENLKYIGKVINKVVENKNTVALIANEKEKNVNLIFASSKDFNLIFMNELLKENIILINGKGGGNKSLAQGLGYCENVEVILENAMKKVKDNVLKNKK